MIDTLLIGYLRLRRSNGSHPHFGPSQDLRRTFRCRAQKKAEGNTPETQARDRSSAKGASRTHQEGSEKAKTQKALDNSNQALIPAGTILASRGAAWPATEPIRKIAPY